jgi:hypothetical protein
MSNHIQNNPEPSELLEPGDPVEVLFKPGWADGWRLVGVHHDSELVTVERGKDGALLTNVPVRNVRGVRK